MLLPNETTDFFTRAGILKGEVNAGSDGWIEDGDAVGGQEDDPLEVL